MAGKRHFGYGQSHFGEDGNGHDLKVFGDTSGKYMLWDASSDAVSIVGGLTVSDGTITGNVTGNVTGAVSGGEVNPTVAVIAGEAIAKGDLVYPSGYDATSGKIKVTKADADGTDPAKVAWFVAPAAIADGQAGTVVGKFELSGQNTDSATAVGDPVYLSATAGGWSLTPPTGAGKTIQQVGVVTVKHASTGKVLLMPFYSKAVTATA
jgi:hypothetical protein